MPHIDLIPYPTLVAQRASKTPDRTYATIPKSDKLEDGFRNFTYRELERGMDKMSWWLEEKLEKSIDIDTVAYMGASDMRYVFLYLAAVKTRRKVKSLSFLQAQPQLTSSLVLFPLSQNSKQSHLSLVNATKCRTLLATPDKLYHWHEISAELEDQVILEMPPFDYFVGEDSEPYPFTKTWDEVKYDPIYVAQTSGTTGTPFADLRILF
jgi:acyl-CoA synthetase (AMP-forming)/AMP-acid ligase II